MIREYPNQPPLTARSASPPVGGPLCCAAQVRQSAFAPIAVPTEWIAYNRRAMRDRAIARVNDGIYYLVTGLWAGAIAMLAVGAPGAFSALRNAEPPAPRADELAGLVVNRMVEGLLSLTLVCAAVTIVCVAFQAVWRPGARRAGAWNLTRLALIAAAAGVLGTVAWGVVPAMNAQRQAMYDPARTAPQREASRADFDRLHKTAERLIGLDGVAIAAAILITPLGLSIESKDQGAEYG